MKGTAFFVGVSAMATGVVGHATFQDLWVNGKDYGSQCVRLPMSNNPVTSVSSDDIRCNINHGFAAAKCTVPAGGTVTVEMHQQPGDRSCSNPAIGGNHYGPVLVYLSKVSDSLTADGSAPFFKIFEDTWASTGATAQGSDDDWGTKDLNANCGKMDVKIPEDLEPGDYLLRSEAIALHTASTIGGAQFYMSCYQITITGSGSTAPSGVAFPGAYKATDPGIEINIYQVLSTYVAPGPTVIAGGTEAQCGKAGSAVASVAPDPIPIAAPTAASGGSGAVPTTLATAVTPAASGGAGSTGSGGACAAGAVGMYQQCGGSGYQGCTTCQSGTCKSLSDYYSQCQ